MILQERQDGLRIVLQPDHAAQAAAIAQHWRKPADVDESIWAQWLHAVATHDDAWRGVEADPPVDEQGRPCGFTNFPVERHPVFAPGGVERVLTGDRYAGVLVAMHFRWLADNLAAERRPASFDTVVRRADERIARSVAALRAAGEPMRTACEPERLRTAQRLLSFMDALALMLVGAIPWREWKDELPFGDRRSMFRVREAQGGGSVEPWPFDVDAVEARVVVRDLVQSRFAGSDAVAAALRDAPPRTVVFTLRRA
jgi:hypothetical protein